MQRHAGLSFICKRVFTPIFNPKSPNFILKDKGAKALLFVVMRHQFTWCPYNGKRGSHCIVFEGRLAMPGIENTVAVPAFFSIPKLPRPTMGQHRSNKSHVSLQVQSADFAYRANIVD